MDASRRLETLENQWTASYKTEFARLVRFFAKRGFCRQTCEDLAQNTLLKAFEKLSDYQGETITRSWLNKIADSKYKNHLRDENAQKRAGHEIPPEDAKDDELRAQTPTPFDQLKTQEQLSIVERCIQQMPVKMRACFTLFTVRERPQADIAKLMKIRLNTVKSHVRQAREHLIACTQRLTGGRHG